MKNLKSFDIYNPLLENTSTKKLMTISDLVKMIEDDKIKFNHIYPLGIKKETVLNKLKNKFDRDDKFNIDNDIVNFYRPDDYFNIENIIVIFDKGNPVACASGTGGLDVIKEGDLFIFTDFGDIYDDSGFTGLPSSDYHVIFDKSTMTWRQPTYANTGHVNKIKK